MAEITVLIVEDDFSYALEVEMIVKDLGYQVLAVVNNSEEALKRIAEKQPDLMLVDIFIDGNKDGIELAESIKSLGITTIFITAHNKPQVYERSRGLAPFAFITKPFDKYTLQGTIESAVHLLGSSNTVEAEPLEKSKHFYIKQNNQLDKVNIDAIHWIEADGNYCIIHTDNRRYAVKISLRRLNKKLPEEQFVQIHRSQIVQLAQIQNLDLAMGLVILPTISLPLGPKYKNELLNRLNLL